MARLFRWLLALAVLGGIAFWIMTWPTKVNSDDFATLTGDAARGEPVFHAAGCASCHTAPNSDATDRPILSGGQRFASDFGTFIAPNISPDATHGIGGWTVIEFANAVQKGVSPDGAHYFPAFPYVAYAKMEAQDVVDLKAFMETLPASDAPRVAHEVGFPFNIRRSLGGWKWLFADETWVMKNTPNAEVTRGRYLAEALAHCGECHTPRNPLGGLDRANWLAGGFIPGEGKVPAITPDQLEWSTQDIAYYLETGFTPEFDSAGGAMTHVVENFGRLSGEDRAAVAAYLKALAQP